MTKTTLACGLILSLTIAACASTPKQATTAAPGTIGAPASSTAPALASAPAKPKLVCEETKPLGSLLPQRICMTPEEAAARQKAAQEKMRNLQNQSQVGPGMGSSSGG